jgi:acyl carrier protein
MQAESLVPRIRTLLVEGLDLGLVADQLTPDFPLVGSGMVDSYGLQEMASFLETEFGVRVEDDAVSGTDFETIGAMARYVAARLEGAAPAAHDGPGTRGTNSPGR